MSPFDPTLLVRPTRVTQSMNSGSDDWHGWRFVTNHAHVLESIAADPDRRLREIAASVGVTERTVAHIVGDLERAGYLTRSRDGRRSSALGRWQLGGEGMAERPAGRGRKRDPDAHHSAGAA